MRCCCRRLFALPPAQSLFHALSQFESVSRYDNATKMWHAGPILDTDGNPIHETSWHGDAVDLAEQNCRWCWQNWSTNVAPLGPDGSFADEVCSRSTCASGSI